MSRRRAYDAAVRAWRNVQTCCAHSVSPPIHALEKDAVPGRREAGVRRRHERVEGVGLRRDSKGQRAL